MAEASYVATAARPRVGFDACGSIYAALVAFDTPSRLSSLCSCFAKLAL